MTGIATTKLSDILLNLWKILLSHRAILRSFDALKKCTRGLGPAALPKVPGSTEDQTEKASKQHDPSQSLAHRCFISSIGAWKGPNLWS